MSDRGVSQRLEALRHLIAWDRPVGELKGDLGEFSWDSEQELIQLDKSDALSVLDRVSKGEMSRVELGQWAEMIESREDIGIDQNGDGLLQQLIFELANADIVFSLQSVRIDDWMNVLR